MRDAIVFVLLLLAISPLAHAEPLSGTLVGKSDGDILNYECIKQVDGKLNCSFVQVLLTKQSNEDDLQESLSSIPAILADADDILETCETFSEMGARIEAFRAGEPIKGISDADALALKESAESGALDLLVAALPAVDAFCAKQTAYTAEGMLRAFYEMGRTTCRPMVNRYEQVFVRVSESLWVVESTPTGECGIVNTSSFYLPDPEKFTMLWNYRAQKIITNKSGLANGVLDCSLLDESPQEYPWNSPAVKRDCVFID